MKQGILSILKKQHKDLRTMLGSLKTLASSSSPDSKKILKELDSFRELLFEHLYVEDNEFYPKLLEKIKKSGRDTSNTKEFIGKMEGIARQVSAFLETYDAEQTLDSNMGDFRINLHNIISTLDIRIDSEENFVFLDWGYL